MTRWWHRTATSVRDSLSSVVVATALAALIVLGVLAVLIFAVRGAQTASSAARMAVSVADVTERGIAATAALQEERALGVMVALVPGSGHRSDYDAAISRTDDAIQDLRVSWSRHRTQVPPSATPPVSDVLAAEVTLAETREATVTPSGESTFDLYSELVGLSLSATGELLKQVDDPTTAGDRAVTGALLTASEALHNQRYLVLSALASGEPAPEELLLQLDVVTDNAGQSLFEARSLAGPSDIEAVEEIRAGPVAQEVEELMGAVVTEDTEVGVTPEEWFDVSSTRIQQVTELIPMINADEAALARQNLDRAQRTLWSRSILLGALFVLTILVAWSAVTATKERGQALTEYGQLTDGLQEWFATASFPDTESVEISARYVPASVRTMAGGDWYDVYEVDHVLAVVIGDVAGHGPQATAHMAQLRNILRGQSAARTLEPAEQVDLLSRTTLDSGIVATLTYGLLDPATGRFVYTRAGHIPLLIRSASGEVRIEEEASGPPVGSGVTYDREQRALNLHPGDALVLITDGLVEGVDRDIDLALDEIAKALAETEGAAESMLDSLFAMNVNQTNDDAAALLVTWNGVPAGEEM